MEYRAVKNRCAVALSSLGLQISKEDALEVLNRKGFKQIDIDIIQIARSCVGSSSYRRGSRLSEAPNFFDCSSFTKWLYGLRGVWLPRRSIQQSELGECVDVSSIESGDLIFVSGWINYYHVDPSFGIGHVGIATDQKTVIHASNSKVGIIESPIEIFMCEPKYRMVKRYIAKDLEVTTLVTPKEREVETSSDIKWILCQEL